MSSAARLPPGRSSIPRLNQAALRTSGVGVCATRTAGSAPAAGTPVSGMHKPGKGLPSARPPRAARSKEGAGLTRPSTRAPAPSGVKVTVPFVFSFS